MSQQVNLFNPAFVPKRELLTGQSLAVWVGVLCLILVGAGSWARIHAKQKSNELAMAQAGQKQAQDAMTALAEASQSRKPSTVLQAEIEQMRRLLAMRDEVLTALKESIGVTAGAHYSDYLLGLARQSRNGLWLLGFSATGGQLTLSGRTLDKALLPDYIRRLNDEPAFAGKVFGGLQMEYREIPRTAVAVAGAVPPAPTSGDSNSAPWRFIEFKLAAPGTSSQAGKKP